MIRVALLIALCGLAGCNPSDGLGRVPVVGRVTSDGQPLAKLSLHLSPVGKTPGNGSLAVTDADGRFRMTDVRGASGAFVGEYQLELNRNGQVELPKDVGKSSPKTATSQLRITVPEGGCDLEIQIPKDGKFPQVTTMK